MSMLAILLLLIVVLVTLPLNATAGSIVRVAVWVVLILWILGVAGVFPHR